MSRSSARRAGADPVAAGAPRRLAGSPPSVPAALAPTALLALLALLAAAVPAAGQDPVHVLIVTGLGGTGEYRTTFAERGSALASAATERWGVPPDRVTWLAEDPALAPGLVDGRSTREGVRDALSDLADRAGAEDRVLLVLIGHGSARGEEATLNLPGPDVSASELAGWLDGLGPRTVAVVNTASASGGFLPALSGEGRIVVTATRSARERERTAFPRFFVEALAGEGADVDRDERVSLLEAFDYARREVERAYDRDGELQTEHALLDDDGDGEGTAEPSAGGPDGRLASRFFLGGAPGEAARATADPELAALLERRRALEGRVAELRARRDSIAAGVYADSLEALLLELATVSRAIREREGEGEP